MNLLQDLSASYDDDHLWWTVGNLDYKQGSAFWFTFDSDWKEEE